MFDIYEKDLVFEGETYKLEITDVGGQPDLKEQRSLAYPSTDIVMMCYRCHSKESFDNIKKFWLDEYKQYELNCPIVLNETQIDNPKEITAKELEELYATTAELDEDCKVSTSAKEGEGITDSFYKVIEVFLNRAQFIENLNKAAAKSVSRCDIY